MEKYVPFDLSPEQPVFPNKRKAPRVCVIGPTSFPGSFFSRMKDPGNEVVISPVIMTSQCIYSVLFVSKNRDEYINNGNCIHNEVETSKQMSSFDFHHFKAFPPVTCKTDCFPFPQPRGDWTIETK